MQGRNQNLQLNQNVKITREKTWQETVAKVVSQLLPRAEVEAQAPDVQAPDVQVGLYYDVNGGEDNLALLLNIDSEELRNTLETALNEYFIAEAERAQKKAVIQVSALAQDGAKGLVIKHEYIPRFFNEICGAVSLYADNHYSLVRDFYGVAPEVSNPASRGQLQQALINKFNELHKAYRASEKMQTWQVAAAHAANGTNRAAPLFKKAHSMVSSQSELYQRLNALVHAYRLGHYENKEVPGFSNRFEAKDQYARTQESYDHGLLAIIHRGDMFYEISDQFRVNVENPGFKLAYVSPDNLFRCGSAALVGGRGTVEEALARVSDYVPRALPGVEPHQHDPQSVLLSLYQSLKPTGKSVRLGAACGVSYMNGQTIPEYIAFEDAKAYSEFAYERMYLGRELVSENGYQDAYANAKANPHLVEGVSFLDAQGKVREVSVMGMVGINGSRPAPGSMASKVVFDDSLDHDNRGFENGQFSMEKATKFYRKQWGKAFDEIIKVRDVTFILNPVGCGAFDPSSDGSQFTAASAQGFAEALSAKARALADAGVSLVLPIYDMKKVYPHYRKALNAVLRQDPVVTCIGGTIASCELAIRKKYDESRGGKYNMEGKSFAQILAHGVNKDGKTRRVLLDLKYIQMNAQNQLVVGEHAPDCVKELYRNIFSALAEPAILKAIINAYTANRKYIHLPVKDGKDDFDIYSASLEDIIRHATSEGKGGKITRAALRNLNYLVSVDTSAGRRLVLNEHGFGNDCPPAPALFIEKYKAVMAPPANNPQPQ